MVFRKCLTRATNMKSKDLAIYWWSTAWQHSAYHSVVDFFICSHCGVLLDIFLMGRLMEGILILSSIQRPCGWRTRSRWFVCVCFLVIMSGSRSWKVWKLVSLLNFRSVFATHSLRIFFWFCMEPKNTCLSSYVTNCIHLPVPRV